MKKKLLQIFLKKNNISLSRVFFISPQNRRDLPKFF